MESNKKSIITKNKCISTRTKNPIRIEPKKYPKYDSLKKHIENKHLGKEEFKLYDNGKEVNK